MATKYWWDTNNMANDISNNIVNRVNTYLQNTNDYVSAFENRFGTRKGNYEDAYVSDSAQWLDQVRTQKGEYDAEYDSILSYMDKYRDYLSSGWLSDVRRALVQGKSAQNKVMKASVDDNMYWESFGTEDMLKEYGSAEGAYKAKQQENADYEEKSQANLSVLRQEIAELEKATQEYATVANQYNAFSNRALYGSEEGRALADKYNALEDLNKQLQEKRKYYDNAKFIQDYASYMANSKADDFGLNSQFKSTRTGTSLEDAAYNVNIGFGDTSMYSTDALFGDFLYDYVNKQEDAVGVSKQNNVADMSALTGYNTQFLETLTNDEIRVFNYLYKTKSPESAKAFLDFLKADLEGRRRVKEQAFYAQQAEESPFKMSVISTLMAPLKGVSYLGQAMDMMEDGKLKENAGYNRLSYIPSTIRSQVASTIENGKWGKVGSFAYNTGMSMADFLFTTAVSGGNQALSLAIMGTGAAADTTISAKDRGLSDGQAFALGTIAGLAEIAMEKISLGAWLDGDMTEGALKYWLSNTFSEGLEETGTSAINLLADVIIAGDKSEWKTAMQDYIDRGIAKTKAEAFGLVAADQAKQMGLDALGGMLSGSAIGGGTYAGASIGAKAQYGGLAKNNAFTTSLTSEGVKLNPDSKYIQKLNTKAEKGKNLTGMQVRNILAANQDAITANDMKKIQQAAEKRLTDLGQTKDVSKVAELATKYATGQKLTRAETSILSRSEYGSKVAHDLLQDSVVQEVNAENYGSKAIRSVLDKMASATYTPLDDRVGDKRTFKVSEDKQATDSKTGDKVDLQAAEVVRVGKDGMTLKVDGKEIKASDIEYASGDQSYLYEAVSKIENITPEAATAIINGYVLNGKQSVSAYLNGIDEAYQHGYYGYDKGKMGQSKFASKLTKEQFNKIYEIGRNASKSSTESADAAKKNAGAKQTEQEKEARLKSGIEGNNTEVYYRDGKNAVKFDKSGKKYDAKRMAAVNTAKFLSKLGIGGKFYFYESYMKDGVRVYKDLNGNEVAAPNGIYMEKDGSIHIDLNAGNQGQGTALFTLGHELTHFIKDHSKQQFKTLSDLVAEAFDKTDLSMHERVLEKQKFLENKYGEPVSYSLAHEEVMADSLSTMLSDGRFYDLVMEIKVKDKGLFRTIKLFFKHLVEKFTSEYAKLTPDQRDAQDIRQMKDMFDKIQKVFAEALVEASDNFQATQAQKNTTEESGVKLMSRDQNQNVIVDENVDSQSVRKVLTDIYNGNYKSNNNYFPVLKHTPEVYKTYCHLDADRSFVMARKKAYKAMRKHALGVDGLMYVIENLGTPDYIVYQTVGEYAGNYAAIIISEEREIFAAVQLGEYKDAQYAPAGEKGYYNTLITAFYPNEGYLDDNIFISENDVVYDKNEDPLQVASGVTPSDRAERSSANNILKSERIVNTESTEAMDINVDEKTESVAPAVMKSERTWTESDYVQERNKAAKEIAKAIGVTEKKAKDYIDSVNSIAKMISEDRSRLDYFSSPGRSSFIGNVEYGGSFDFSTLCKKRRLLTGTFTAIQKALPNTALTANEILDIRNRMKDAGLEVSCGLCYVEGSRANMGQFAKEFLRLYKQYYPDAWQPNMADVNTPDGIEWVRINHPECYEQYEYFWNHYGTLKDGDKNLFASQQKPKLYQLHTEYKGEILQKFKDDDNVEEKNINGGIRLQSFSDFEIVHLIDTMQIIMDMSRVGLAGQAYTKVPDFAWALGDTGLKINLSLIAKGVDENGKLIFDDVEGMPIAEAMKLRDRYSKNVGTILVAFNDEQLLAAMADDRVDFIIPFHRSQWKKSQYEAMGLPAKTKDYTYMQNEKFIKPQFHEYRGRMVRDKATNYMPNEYWDFSKSGKENAVAYLEMCARNNKRPKFYKLLQNNGDGSYSLKADGSTDGYWKLLIDFKMYDNEGNGSPQMAVKPEFNMDEANRMLETYKGGHSIFPVAQGIVDGFVKEYKASHKGEKFSLREPIEETKNLLAYHNITPQLLADVLNRNGLLMPSLAVTNKGMTDFGDISLLFDKATIDPSANKQNKLYGADAWTPTQTKLKKNAKFDTDKTVNAVNSIKSSIGSKYVSDLFNITAKQFRDSIIKADGSIYDAYAHNIGVQTAYAMEKGIISKIPTKNGVVDKTALQEQINSKLDTDNGWRQYKRWLNNISDTIITSYDQATNEDILKNMKAQPATAKQFKLSETGELVVPAVEYSSIDEVRKNKNRLSENADEATKAVASEFLNFAKKIGNTQQVVDAINASFDSRYSIVDIVRSFNTKGIKITNETAGELQALYKKAVELPTQYFEAKPGREVGLDEIKAVVMPTGTEYTELKSKLEDLGIQVVEYDGSNESRVEALNSMENLKFSERGEDTSNRALLANAFEGLSRSSVEYAELQEYKKQIKVLNMLDEQLSDLNAEIHEIRFTKGKYDAEKLKKLEAKAERIARDINKQDKVLIRMEASEPLRKIIEFERKKASQKTKEHIAEIQQNKKARAEQTELRHKIRRTVRDLDKLLNRGNKKKNVKEDMQGFVSKALELADYLFTDHISNDELIRRGITVRMTVQEAALVKETEDIIAQIYDNADNLTDEEFTQLDDKRKANESKLRDLLTAQRNERLSTPVYNLFNDLVTEYASLKNSSQEAVRGAYDPKVEEFLRSYLGENADGTDSDRKTLLQNMRLADMTTEELWKLYNAYTMVLHSVRKANELFVKGKTESLDEMATRIMTDFSKRKAPDGKAATVIRNLSNKLGWDYEKLHYALDRIGSEAFTELVMNLANAENTVMEDVKEAKAFLREIVKKYDFNNWDYNKEINRDFLDTTGKKFRMTLGQLMSLYAYSRRDGAWDHIEYGGFVFGEAALTNPKPADSYKLSKDQCEAITNTLTKEQKAYVEDMQKFLSETMGAKGNEVSMLLYGIKMFGEKNYFPIHIAGQFKAQANESQAKAAAGFSTMTNAGFTHAQNPNAKAPFVLEGFNEIWADHVNEMSRYHGTVPALEDMRRVMNRSSYSESTSESVAIKQQMENSFGKEAVDYFDNLYREANSGAITDKLQKWPKKLLSLFRKNSVAYSLSVVIQQPSAMARAYAMIDKKYFGFKGVGALTSGIAKAVSSKWNPAYANAYNEMLKYAPGVTLAKEIGGFDTHTGTSIREYLLDTEKSFKQSMKTENLKGKGKAVLDLVDDNAIANLPNAADKIAWIEIWNACKRETVAKRKDLAVNSNEFMQIVGERFTEVIRATQVYDSIFAKSPMMKSKNLAVQYLVSFMNEPNTTANMAEKAVRDVANGNWKGGLRIAGAVTYSIIFNNVLKAIVYAMRDDDEDETYIEKYIAAVSGGMMDDFNPINYVPIARDVLSKARGFDVERPDMAIISDAIDAFQAIAKVKGKDTEGMTEEEIAELEKKITEANWKLVGSLCAFFGIPVKNIYREIEGVINHARIASSNAGMTTANSLWDKVKEEVLDSIPFVTAKDTKTDKLYDAIVSGDTKYLKRIKGTYKSEDSYRSAVRKALRENDTRIHDAAQARIDGNTEEYKRIFREIQNEGKFGFDDIMSAVNSEESKIRKGIDPEKATSEYTANGYVEAIAMGNTTEAMAMKDDIIAAKVANGKTPAEAEKEFRASVATGIGEAYSSGLLNDAQAKEMLMEYAGKDKDDAASKVSYWSFLDAHPEYEQYKLSESNVNDYLEFAEPAEITMDVFVQYRDGTKGLADVKDEWGDVEVTKREQVLEVIDSLDLTWQQKDALYLAAGYSESKIWDVPW